MIISFIVFIAAFLAIGVSAARKSRNTKEDYYLASKGVAPWLVGLSAVATNNSGYMFIGAIGYSYSTGLASIWLMVGWILGDYVGSLFVHRRLRSAAGRTGEASYTGVLASWQGTLFGRWQKVAAIICLLFLLVYASAQLVAGSKALQVLFDWPAWAGAVMGAVMVVIYCFAGGIRASIWTDAAQSFVMVAAMGLMLVIATLSFGGMSGALDEMGSVDGFLDWYPRDLIFPGLAGGLLFIFGWLFAGLSVIGQPHVMVRFMTLDADRNMNRARAWYYGWFTVFYAMAVWVGMLSRIYLPGAADFDAELALPTMAVELLHPWLVGLVLAGIFAATMSTADSLLLSCSASFTHDLLPQNIERPLLLKFSTLGMTALALAWALLNEQSVFNLVVMSWSALASAFAPLLIVLALRRPVAQWQAFVMMFVGMAVALGWRAMGWHEALYEGMPGILAGLLIYGLSYWLLQWLSLGKDKIQPALQTER